MYMGKKGCNGVHPVSLADIFKKGNDVMKINE
jgi:hypothetical protein